MYNGIGLSTARGSGTNGYVQRNLSNLHGDARIDESGGRQYLRRQLRQKNERKQIAATVRDREIDLHERKRQLEIKVMEYRETLEDEGLEDSEIDKKVEEYREKLRNEKDTREKSPTRAKDSRPGNRPYHEKADPFLKQERKPAMSVKPKRPNFASMY